MKKKPKQTAPTAWNRYSRERGFYFLYDHRNQSTRPLLESGKYGVVQLICIKNTARAAFMAGFRAGRRASNGDGDL